MNETVTAFLKVSHNLVRTEMYSFLFVRLGIMSRGPDRTFQGAVSGPRAVVCPSLPYSIGVRCRGGGESGPNDPLPFFYLIFFLSTDLKRGSMAGSISYPSIMSMFNIQICLF